MVRFSAIARYFSPNYPNRLRGPFRLFDNGYRELFPQVKQPEREAANSHPLVLRL
jgi:hypothetical protein